MSAQRANGQRLQAVKPRTATGKTRELLDEVQATLGMTPNVMRTMATAPAVLEAYLSFSKALSTGTLPIRLRQQVALTVADANRCDYCLAANTAVGRVVGLSQDDLMDSRLGISCASRARAALQFSLKVVQQRGCVGDEDVARVRRAGYSDGEIAELVETVALNIFTNYFNHVARTEIDFPDVSGPSRQSARDHDTGSQRTEQTNSARRDSVCVRRRRTSSE